MRPFAIVSIGFCLALLAALVIAVEPARVLAAFEHISLVHVVVALLAVQVQILTSALRWRFTAARLGVSITLPYAIREYYIGTMLNLVLPGGMAGDAMRAYRSRVPVPGGWRRPAAAVFLERLSGQAAFFVLTALGLLAWPVLLNRRLPDQFEALVWVVAGLSGLVIGAAIVLRKSWLPEKFTHYRPQIAAALWRDGAWKLQFALSALIVATYVITFFLASDAVGAELPLIAAFTIIPVCLMTMLVPAGIGGWGTREAVAAALWPVFGFSSAEGFAASLLYGLASLAGAALPGLVFLVFSFIKRPA